MDGRQDCQKDKEVFEAVAPSEYFGVPYCYPELECTDCFIQKRIHRGRAVPDTIVI